MTKHMNRNALLVAYVSNSTFVEANGGGVMRKLLHSQRLFCPPFF